jgi:hypothetical protein
LSFGVGCGLRRPLLEQFLLRVLSVDLTNHLFLPNITHMGERKIRSDQNCRVGENSVESFDRYICGGYSDSSMTIWPTTSSNDEYYHSLIITTVPRLPIKRLARLIPCQYFLNRFRPASSGRVPLTLPYLSRAFFICIDFLMGRKIQISKNHTKALRISYCNDFNQFHKLRLAFRHAF